MKNKSIPPSNGFDIDKATEKLRKERIYFQELSQLRQYKEEVYGKEQIINQHRSDILQVAFENKMLSIDNCLELLSVFKQELPEWLTEAIEKEKEQQKEAMEKLQLKEETPLPTVHDAPMQVLRDPAEEVETGEPGDLQETPPPTEENGDLPV